MNILIKGRLVCRLLWFAPRPFAGTEIDEGMKKLILEVSTINWLQFLRIIDTENDHHMLQTRRK